MSKNESISMDSSKKAFSRLSFEARKVETQSIGPDILPLRRAKSELWNMNKLSPDKMLPPVCEVDENEGIKKEKRLPFSKDPRGSSALDNPRRGPTLTRKNIKLMYMF